MIKTDKIKKYYRHDKQLPNKKLLYDIIEQASPLSSDIVLDVGTGQGNTALAFAERVIKNGKVFALDNNLDILKVCKMKIKKSGTGRVILICADATEFPFKSEIFDIIVCRGAFRPAPKGTERSKKSSKAK